MTTESQSVNTISAFRGRMRKDGKARPAREKLRLNGLEATPVVLCLLCTNHAKLRWIRPRRPLPLLSFPVSTWACVILHRNHDDDVLLRRVRQIFIIEFGGTAFSTASLDIDHWIWCILFGAGELLWGQVSARAPSLWSTVVPSVLMLHMVAQKVSHFQIIIKSYWKPVSEANFFCQIWV